MVGASARYDPEGRLMQTVELPVSRVTNCTFGGEHFDQPFVTSASAGLSNAERVTQPLQAQYSELTSAREGNQPTTSPAEHGR